MSGGRVSVEALLPFAAPAPAGVVIAAQMYGEVYKALGSPVTTPELWTLANGLFLFVVGLAVVGAVFGFVGMVGGEMLTYKYAFASLADGERWAAMLMFVLGIFCTGLVIWSVARTDDSRPLVGAVLVSVVLYIAAAVREYLLRKRDKRRETQAVVSADRAHELAMEQQRTRQLQADARREKAKASTFERSPTENEHNERPPKQGGRQSLAIEKVEEIREYQRSNPNKSVRDVAAACGVSVGSVAKYGVAAQAAKGE
jgi:hypothetical protein